MCFIFYVVRMKKVVCLGLLLLMWGTLVHAVGGMHSPKSLRDLARRRVFYILDYVSDINDIKHLVRHAPLEVFALNNRYKICTDSLEQCIKELPAWDKENFKMAFWSHARGGLYQSVRTELEYHVGLELNRDAFCNDKKLSFLEISRDFLEMRTVSDDLRFLAKFNDGVIKVIDRKSGGIVFELALPVCFIELDFDGSLLVTVDNDGTMCLWDIAADTCLWSTKLMRLVWDEEKEYYVEEQGVIAKVKALAFNPYGFGMAMVTDEGAFRMYDLGAGLRTKYSFSAVHSGGYNPNNPCQIKFDESGYYVAFRFSDCEIYSWELKDSGSRSIAALFFNKPYRHFVERVKCAVNTKVFSVMQNEAPVPAVEPGPLENMEALTLALDDLAVS
jgi:hypothetical protein